METKKGHLKNDSKAPASMVYAVNRKCFLL